jgi:hypothetical protein
MQARTEKALISAAANAELEKIEPLVLGGISPNTVCVQGYAVIFHAVTSGDVRPVQLLIDLKANPHAVSAWDAWTPLHVACLCEEENTAIVGLLLQSSPHVHSRTKEGMTPLYAAVQTGHFESLKLLLAAGADPQSPLYNGSLPLQAAKLRPEVEIETFLKEQGCTSQAWYASTVINRLDRLDLYTTFITHQEVLAFAPALRHNSTLQHINFGSFSVAVDKASHIILRLITKLPQTKCLVYEKLHIAAGKPLSLDDICDSLQLLGTTKLLESTLKEMDFALANDGYSEDDFPYDNYAALRIMPQPIKLEGLLALKDALQDNKSVVSFTAEAEDAKDADSGEALEAIAHLCKRNRKLVSHCLNRYRLFFPSEATNAPEPLSPSIPVSASWSAPT